MSNPMCKRYKANAVPLLLNININIILKKHLTSLAKNDKINYQKISYCKKRLLPLAIQFENLK